MKERLILKKIILVFILTVILGDSFLIRAQTEEKLVTNPFPFVYYHLKNGLGVIMAEDDTLPVITIAVAYKVGSSQEKPGQTGLAFLLENLMFQGSMNVGPMQHFSYISRVGGRSEAKLSEDLTIFYQTVPSHQLPLVLWLESDRMLSLNISEEHIDRSKIAVLDELVQRRLREPFLDSFIIFDQLLYRNFSLSHPVLGTEEDVVSLTVDDVREFYKNYYVPNNAVLCLIGDFNRRRARELIEKYFESIPKGKTIPAQSEILENFDGPIFKIYVDPLVPAPAFHLAYRVAPMTSEDFPVFKIIEYLLIRGKTSWLQRRLLRREKLVVRIDGGLESKVNSAFLRLFAVANNEVMIERSLKAIEAEISRLKSTLVSAEELEIARNKYRADLNQSLETTAGRALFLAEMYFRYPSLEDIAKHLERPLKVAASEIVGLANRYFTNENLAILKIRIR
ncbi:MAG: insulinase family protein [Candidatus Aminicenantes bacterium]|nr:insulinase family protein [Candidatus Aminicenantes bacterium]